MPSLKAPLFSILNTKKENAPIGCYKSRASLALIFEDKQNIQQVKCSVCQTINRSNDQQVQHSVGQNVQQPRGPSDRGLGPLCGDWGLRGLQKPRVSWILTFSSSIPMTLSFTIVSDNVSLTVISVSVRVPCLLLCSLPPGDLVNTWRLLWKKDRHGVKLVTLVRLGLLESA